jgi:CHAD domain-containing protein
MPVNVDRIQKSVRKIRKYVKKAPTLPTPEQIHDLRTNTRKLESALHALSLDSNGDEQRLLKSVKRIRKRAGKIRDMDVLTANMCHVKVNGEGDCEVQLLEHLGARRHKYAKKLHSTVLQESAVLRKTLQREVAELDVLMQDSKPEQAAAQAGAHALELASQLTDPPRLNRSNLHPYRLKVKELRYVLQMAEDNGQSEFVEDLGELKDCIGEWHDWEELTAIAADVLDHGSSCRLQQELKRIGESKYEHALALATKLRKTYLKTSARKKSRTVDAGQQFSRPVLVAAAALTSGTQKRAA